MIRQHWLYAAGLFLIGQVGFGAQAAAGELSKVDRLLQANGLQLAGSASPDADFSMESLKGANYSTLLWTWKSNVQKMGTPPGEIAWGRWAGDEKQMPPEEEEGAYMKKMVALQLGDEPPIYQEKAFKKMVDWMSGAQANPAYKNVILFTDLSGVDDGTVGKYIRAAHPDMLTFDTYPWQSEFVGSGKEAHGGKPFDGPPVGLYYDLRRYRADTVTTGTEYGLYRQTFHAVEDYGPKSGHQMVYRNPTGSELGLNTFAPLAFNAKMVIDFQFTGGASSLFEHGVMKRPTVLYPRLAQVNRAAGLFGRALVRLTPINDVQNGAEPTTDVLFIRGEKKPGEYAAVYGGFRANGGDEKSYITQWTAYSTAEKLGKPEMAEDPWVTGFDVRNLGKVNAGLKGDAIIAWFKPIGMSKADAWEKGQVYFMVVNGLTSANPRSIAADCEQCVQMDFSQTPGEGIEYVDAVSG
ncbi:MAG TPA: hypothetical protein VFE58_02645, partial [Tepidisphaeraceae bacterium]|nr:hypothetical protein [Tepidisphaeraceae bacterium]